MTAIVAILNKNAVAIAADSAVTTQTNNGRKVLNSANKIFSLSRKNPVGVMCYSSASFMGTPWELIIKLYRDNLGDKSFCSLKEYIEDFKLFIRNNDYFCSEKMQSIYLTHKISLLFSQLKKEVCCLLKPNPSETEVYEKQKELIQNYLSKEREINDTNEWSQYELNDFKEDTKDTLDAFAKSERYESDSKYRDEVEQFIFDWLRTHYDTGLVFVGYGDKEIFPSVIPLNVSFAYKNRLNAYIDNKNSHTIGEDKGSAIVPFAQADVMFTFLTGINQGILQHSFGMAQIILDQNIRLIMQSVKHGLQSQLDKLGIDSNIISDIIREVDMKVDVNLSSNNLLGFFKDSLNNKIQSEHTDKLLSTVAYLGKEDLSNMAKSLIELTCLERRMTSSEESVGGPVDVAVISKSDGFIWIDRKHYFDKEINAQFFSRYNS